MKKIYSLVVAFFLISATMNAVAQTDTNEWFSKKEWLGGLAWQPHPSIDKEEFARQYQVNKMYWDKAFAFLKERDLQTLANGRYAIDSENVFAIVTENPTKDYDSTIWESHRNYIDLHYVISGREKIGVCPVTKLMVIKQYDPAKDLANYSGTGKLYYAAPGTFFLFFPSDGHRPNITPGDKKTDKKIVVKIRYAD
jgi:biofilm protein TabA